jgi:protein-disulfide isomerase
VNSKFVFAISLVITAAASLSAGFFAGKNFQLPPSLNSTPESPLGSLKGITILRSALTSAEKQRLYEAETQVFNTVSRIVEERFVDQFFENIKTQKSLPTRAAAQELYFHENSSISEARVSEIVAQFASDDRLKNLSPEEQKKEVRRALEMQESQNALRALVLDARQKRDFVVAMPEPTEPVLEVGDGGNPSVGPANAKVTIVEFADYECPFCARVVPTLWEVTKKYDGKVRWVFRDFPLPFHKQSMPSAIAANCAGAQGKYFEAHNFLFENHNKLGEETFVQMANTLKLDVPAFQSCRADPAQKQEVENDLAAGEKLGVNGTPMYFVNGKRMKSGATVESFSAIIDAELAKQPHQ